jgi:hypothetical protein
MEPVSSGGKGRFDDRAHGFHVIVRAPQQAHERRAQSRRAFRHAIGLGQVLDDNVRLGQFWPPPIFYPIIQPWWASGGFAKKAAHQNDAPYVEPRVAKQYSVNRDLMGNFALHVAHFHPSNES